MSAGGALTLPGVSPVSAQETEAELLRRIDSLTVLAGEAAIAAQAARDARAKAEARLAEAEYSLDTVRVADMTIVTRESDAAEARELFTEVWNESFGGYRSRAPGNRTFTYLRAAYTVDPIPARPPAERVVVPTWQSRSQAKARVRSAIGQVLAEDLGGSPVGAWLRRNPFSDRAPGDVYRQMVLARSSGVERCLAGDVPSCTAALGLGPDGNTVSAWYSPEERRVRALEGLERVGLHVTSGPSPVGDVFGSALARCVDRATPDACDALLGGDPDSFAPLPFSVRATLANLALERGGRGAWTRLAQDPSMAAGEALAGAADSSLEELVSDWRAWVVESRPEAQAGLGGDSVLALVWILFFAALATRSTRWRFA